MTLKKKLTISIPTTCQNTVGLVLFVDIDIGVTFFFIQEELKKKQLKFVLEHHQWNKLNLLFVQRQHNSHFGVSQWEWIHLHIINIIT